MSSDAGQTIHRAEPDPGRFRCLECSQTFGRVEHLTRHSRSHSKERYLKCSYCHKGFYRGSVPSDSRNLQLPRLRSLFDVRSYSQQLTSCDSDALRRHEQVHKEPKRSTLGRGIRACLACAKARRKCSGENPCFACDKRSIECNYPQSSNSRDKLRSENLNGDSMVSSDDQSTAPPNGQDLEVGQVITSPRESSTSWSNMSRSPAAADARHEQLNSEPSQHHYGPDGDVMDGIDMETPNFHVPSGVTQTAIQRQMSLGPHNNNLDGPREVPVATPLPPFLRDTVIDFRRGASSETRQPWSSSGSAPQAMNVGPGTALSNINDRTTEPNFWSQNSLSSINWLPDDWIPDFQFGPGESAPLSNYPGPNQASQGRSMSIPDTVGSTISHLNGSTPSFNSDQGISSPKTVDSNGVGYYYVDGDGARLPRVRKAPHRSPHQSSDTYTPLSGIDGLEFVHTKFGFPAIEFGVQDNPAMSSVATKRIPVETYNEITRIFSQTCITSTYFSPFHTGEFPSLETMSRFVGLYIEHFQPILPFIHPATFNISSSHWLLVLAMAAIGSHYAGIEDVEILVVAMNEFLRRAISMMVSLGPSCQTSYRE